MKNKFGMNLRKIRKKENLSQEDLAEILNVSRQSISKWESGSSYPEMEKIITISNLYNLSIDDLLDGEVYIDESNDLSEHTIVIFFNKALKYIEGIFNSFLKLSTKTKIKAAIEIVIIALFLNIAASVISRAAQTLIYSIFTFLPTDIYYYIIGVLGSIFNIVFTIASLIIVMHLFNVRYLKYAKENTDTSSIDQGTEESKDNENNKNENIVLRDQEDSSSRIIDMFIDFLVIFFKIMLIPIVIGIFALLIMSLVGFVFIFNLIKTGLLFAGLFLLSVSLIYILSYSFYILLSIVLNNKVKMKPFIISLVLVTLSGGISLGLISTGTLEFNYYEDKYFEDVIYEYDSEEDLDAYIGYYKETYIDEDIDNIKIVITKWKHNDITLKRSENNIISIDQNNYFDFYKESINVINKKEIIPFNSVKVKIYANSSNMDEILDRDF